MKAGLWPFMAQTVQAAFRTVFWLLSIMIPVSFGVWLLKLTGLMDVVTRLFEPIFALIGLPGEAALVFATAGLVSIYAAIAVIETLALPMRTVTILALMCLISHNLPVECAIQKKTGSRLGVILAVRLAASLAGALILGALLPQTDPVAAVELPLVSAGTLPILSELKLWLSDIGRLSVKILVLVTALMFLQRLLETLGIIEWLSRLLKYPLIAFGIPPEAAFLWVVANTLGLAYGAGIILDHVRRGRLTVAHSDRLNYHIAISHSLLEDTLLFAAIGVSAWWITLPRLFLAGLAVWIKRLVDALSTNKKRKPLTTMPDMR